MPKAAEQSLARDFINDEYRRNKIYNSNENVGNIDY